MKTKFIKLFLITVVPILMIVTLIKNTNAYETGRKGNAYAPGEKTCRECHADYALNTANGAQVYIPNINTLFPNGQYVPGQTYNMSITIAAGSLTTGLRTYGFAIEVLTTASPYSNAGTLTATDLVNSQEGLTLKLGQNRKTVYHTDEIGMLNPTSSGSRTINFQWVAPSSGSVTFHLTGLVGNNMSTQGGDYVAVKKYKITG